jgi:hypothetical protein
MKRMERAITLVAGLALAACDGGTAPDADLGDLNLAVATVAAEATLDDVESMALQTWGVPLGDVAAGPGAHHPMAPGDALERSRTVTFYDESGSAMEAYDPLLTERIDVSVEIVGSLERPMWSGEVERHRDVSVTGLSGEETERTWNGTGSDEHSSVRVVEEGDMERRFESQTTIEDVVVALPRSENPWPIAGTITRQVVVTVINGPEGDVTRERTVVITFDGTQYATLTVDGEEFEIDLADRQGRRPHRRGPR